MKDTQKYGALKRFAYLFIGNRKILLVKGKRTKSASEEVISLEHVDIGPILA